MKTDEIQNPVDIFFRIFPPTAGALLASIIALMFYALYSRIPGISGILITTQSDIPYSGFLLFGVTFLVSLLANVIAVVFLSLANKHIYGAHFRQAVAHIFFITVALFALSSPIFLLFPKEFGFLTAQFLMPFTAIAAALIFEVCNLPENAVRAAYKGIFSGIIIILVTLLAINISHSPEVLVIFFLMPIAWFLIPLTSLVVGILADVVFNKPNT